MPRRKPQHYFGAILLIYVALVAGYYTVYLQKQVFGYDKIDIYQIPLHDSILRGDAGNPWQYRVLGEWVLRVIVRGVERTGASPIDAAHSVFMTTRYIQNMIIFLLLAYYYRVLGLSTVGTLLGMLLLVWGISRSFLNTNLQFNTYFDIIFYLLAGIAIVHKRYWAIVPITFLGAFNRETSGLIPFMLLLESMRLYDGNNSSIYPHPNPSPAREGGAYAESPAPFTGKGAGGRGQQQNTLHSSISSDYKSAPTGIPIRITYTSLGGRRVMILNVGRWQIAFDWQMLRFAVISIALYMAIFVGLRWYYAPQVLIEPLQVTPGKELFEYNIKHRDTWDALFYTIGVFPFLALLGLKRMPRPLPSFFLAVVPIWFVIHFFGSLVVETRLFLVPYAVILIPGVLLIARE